MLGFADGSRLGIALSTSVSNSASGATTWTYTDDQGKTVETLSLGFGGGFLETLATYNALGNVTVATKPFAIQSLSGTPASTYQVATTYDGFNRVQQVAEDLGPVGASGASKQLVTTTMYGGLSLTTTRTVNGGIESHTETKNVLGKLQSVIDSLGSEIDYRYDPDGDLVVASTGGSNL